jgi:hypothetical protein
LPSAIVRTLIGTHSEIHDRSRRPDRAYGGKVVAVEPGGNEPIPAAERHGRPGQLFWTWTSPNLEFATIFVGVLAVAAFGLTFWQAVAAIVLGNGLAALAHGVVSARWSGSRWPPACTRPCSAGSPG